MHSKISLNSRQSVVEQLQAVSSNVISLDMSSLRLGDLPIEEIESLLSLIKPSVLYLNVGTNRIHNLQGDNLTRIFSAISKTNARYLSLQHNELGSVKTEELLPAFSVLSHNLIAFDLSHNEFWRKTSVEWRCLFATTPPMTYLNLSGCNFMLTRGGDMVQKND